MRICRLDEPPSGLKVPAPPAPRALHLLRTALSRHGLPEAESHQHYAGLGAFMKEARIVPGLVLCSNAGAAQDSMEALWPHLPGPPLVSSLDSLLHAGAHALLARLRSLGDEIKSVLVIGHDPGLTELALKLSRGYGPRAARLARDKIYRAFPEGTLATLNILKPSWADLGPKCGLLTTVVRPDDFRPRDL